MLKINSEVWCLDSFTLKQHTTQYFQYSYTTVVTRDFKPTLDQCPTLVQEHMNAALMSPVTMKISGDAVFLLEAINALGLDGLNGLFFQHH